MKKIHIFTDGSCIGNPGPGGWAFLILDDEEKKSSSTKNIFHRSDFFYHTTNNRMEMMAILEALKYSQENFSDYQIELNSDSNLLIQTLNLGWKRKANLDLWSQIDAARKNLRIKFTWVKAHAHNKYNNLCDEYAQKASAKAAKLIQKNPALAAQAELDHNNIATENSLQKNSNKKKSGQDKPDQISLF